MNVGMLWFDNDPKAELSTKIERAASYYQDKYGKTPTLCFVHPSMLAMPPEAGKTQTSSGLPSRDGLKARGIEVRSTRSVLPNHFWIGTNSQAE